MTKHLISIFIAVLLGTPALSIVSASAPIPIEVFAPQYWQPLHSALISGTVKVRVDVDPAGTVLTAKAVKGSYAPLVPPSETSARRWRFTPAQGSQTRSAILVFEFILLSGGGNPDAVPVGTRFIPPYKVQVIEVGP